ncbi:hypothetical protein [Sulfitobacter sp. 1A15106]|uniref:hypothetical protein n=1 Tax=Sulfitobacter sp. 1A15106 TaxID=3368590 RepID=UPI003747637F
MSIKTKDVNDEETYYVTLLRPVRVNRTFLRPGAVVKMKGMVIKEHENDIERVQAAAI